MYLLAYHAGIQPSEIERLSTLEFNKYQEFLVRDIEREVEKSNALGSLLSMRSGKR